MQDMRYLYGMPKTASARREEFVGNLRNYFGSLRLDGMPVKTASEKRAVVAGLLSKYANDDLSKPKVNNVSQTTSGSGQNVKRTVNKVRYIDASPEERKRMWAEAKKKQDAAQRAYEEKNRAVKASTGTAWADDSYISSRNRLLR